MPRNDCMPKPRHGAFLKGLVESGPGSAASKGLHLSEEHRVLGDSELAELRRLAEEGRVSGLSDEDGEALIDRLEAKYRSIVERKSEA